MIYQYNNVNYSEWKQTIHVTDKINFSDKRLSSACHEQMCHEHYEEQDSERFFFLVEAFRRSVWLTCCLLATNFT